MKRAIVTLGLIALVLVLGACSNASANNPSPAGTPAAPVGDAIQISSKDLKFSTATLTAPANKAFQIV